MLLTSPAYELHIALDRVQRKRRIKYFVAPIAPSNLAELNSSATSRLVVYSDYCDRTIFGHAPNNRLQRAWHDTIHMELQADVDDANEYRVATHQCRELSLVSGDNLAAWLWADLNGQTRHWRTFGCFPDDQAAFVAHLLATGEIKQF